MHEFIKIPEDKVKSLRLKTILRDSSNALTGGSASTISAMVLGLLNPEAIGLISSMGRIFPLFDGVAVMLPHRISEKLGWTFHILAFLWCFFGSNDPKVFAITLTMLFALSALTRLSYDEWLRDVLTRNSTPKDAKKYRGIRNSVKAICGLAGVGFSVVLALTLDWRSAYYVIGILELIHIIIKVQLNFEAKDLD